MQKKKLYKYIVCQSFEDVNHAGPKARRDVVAILKKDGWKEISFMDESIINESSLIGTFKRLISSFHSFFKIRKNSFLLVQYPLEHNSPDIFYLLLPIFKKLNKLKCYALIHDLNSIRFKNNIYCEIEKKRLAVFDNIISHNKVMTDFLTYELKLNKNIKELVLFDYLSNYTVETVNYPINEVVFAGNLTKSTFCKELKNVNNINFILYGIMEDKEKIIHKNVHYKGSFSPEEIVTKLEGSWGLVWDGDSIETCGGKYGEYLKFNASHKNSLYIVAGLPLIVWKDAAIANYVLEKNIGITVSSLYEIHDIITNMSYDDYQIMKANVQKIASKLKNGDTLLKIMNEYE